MNMNNTLRLPLQTAPIDRSPSAAALSGSGVEASFDFGDIISSIGKAIGPAIGPALGQLAQTGIGALLDAI
jgi:hypothetical protein